MTQSHPFLSILGIGEDGVAGLSEAARQLIAAADLVMGGARHLALADGLIHSERMAWPSPIDDAIPLILARRPQKVVVLASGDPFCFGVGTMLAEAVQEGHWHCIPAPSSFSLACARLGWALQDVGTISFCGRPLAALAPLLQPGARLLALSADAATPAEVAALMTELGFGASRITVLEALGGPQERITGTGAAVFDVSDINNLNLLAIEVHAEDKARIIPLTPGLDDDIFAHDGQITRREIRAATLSMLEPTRGALLWDVGTGSGSIAIEWLLRHPSNRAIGIDRHVERLARAAANAGKLGVPSLRLVEGTAPEAFAGLPTPDCVFIGGGAQGEGVIEAAWAALRPRGRMVVNAVTIETEAVLFDALRRLGGSLTRIAVERLDRIGSMHGFRPGMTITQWSAVKP